MKPTNDERHEIAAKMRKNADDNVIFVGTTVADEIGTRFFKDAKCWNRLADLVEPDNIPDNADENAHGLSGSCDRDALLDLADSMDGYARFCKEHSIQVGSNLVECYADCIREAVNACEGDSDAHMAGDDVQGGTDAHMDGNEAAEGARTPSIEVFQWVKDHGGLDEVKRRVWASNELEAKLRSRERKIERLKKQLGYADAKNAERRAGAKWLKEHGGLCAVRRRVRNADNRLIELCDALDVFVDDAWNDVMAELRKRLMPEGMEWPVFEDGEPVRIGDVAVLADNEPHEVESMEFFADKSCKLKGKGTPWMNTIFKGQVAKRPAPEALDADGVEIRVGDRLYDTDTGCGRTVRAINDNGTVEFEGCEDRGWFTRFLTHRAPVLAADGKPLREGETVYKLDDDRPYTLKRFDGDHVYINAGGSSFDIWTFPNKLTHERPVLDAGGVPIKVGDTVYVLGFDEPLTVKGFADDGSVLMSFHDENSLGYKPSKLTHERPESKCRDCAHWQKDPTADNMGVCWFFYHEHEGHDCYAARRGDIGACEEFMPRAKALADRGE